MGAHGLAVIFGGCGVWAALVEAWWYFTRKDPKGKGDTVSKETGRIWGVSRLRFYAVLALLTGGSVGLVLHLYVMKR